MVGLTSLGQRVIAMHSAHTQLAMDCLPAVDRSSHDKAAQRVFTVVMLGILALIFTKPVSAWNPLRDVSRAVRKASTPHVARLLVDVQKSQQKIEEASNTATEEQLKELFKKKAEAEAAVIEAERKIRIRTEERALAKIESELTSKKTVAYEIDHIAYTAISNSLYGAKLELEPIVYENYTFLLLEPHTLLKEGDSELQLRSAVFWNKNEDRLTIRYVALEKRLRSPEPRVTSEPRLVASAAKYIESLAEIVVARGVAR
jgi:hypothetical protein